MWYGSLLKYSQYQDTDAVELQGGQDSALGARVLDPSALTLTHVAPCAFAIPRHLRHLVCQMKFRCSQRILAFFVVPWTVNGHAESRRDFEQFVYS